MMIVIRNRLDGRSGEAWVETYHPGEDLSLEVLQGQLEASIAVIVKNLDGNGVLWARMGRSWCGHDV